MGKEQYKYAGREIAVSTYNVLWFEGYTQEQRSKAIAEEVTRATGIENPSAMQILDYYENKLRDEMIKKYGKKRGSQFTLNREGLDDVDYLFDRNVTYTENGSPIVFNVESAYSKFLG